MDVTVMLPVYNAMPYLPAAVDSILAQKFSGTRELLIVNDGSTDAGADFLGSLGRSSGGWPVRVIHQDNRGLGVTRTRLLREARGRFLIGPDADDVLKDGIIELLLQAFSRTDAGFVYTDHQQIAGDGTPGAVIRKACLHDRFDRVIYHNFFCGHLKAYDATRVRGFEFEPDLRSAQDYEFILKIFPYMHVEHVPTAGYLYRVHPGGQYARTRARARQLAAASVRRWLDRRRLYGGKTVHVERVVVEGGSYFEHVVDGRAVTSAADLVLLTRFLGQYARSPQGARRSAHGPRDADAES